MVAPKILDHQCFRESSVATILYFWNTVTCFLFQSHRYLYTKIATISRAHPSYALLKNYCLSWHEPCHLYNSLCGAVAIVTLWLNEATHSRCRLKVFRDPKKRQALQNRRIMRPGFRPPIAFCRSPSVASALWQKVTTERDSWQRQRERELGVEKALEMWNRLPTKGCILHPSGCQHRWTHHCQYYCVTCGLTEANAVFHRKSQKEVTVLAGFTSHTLHHCDDVGEKKRIQLFNSSSNILKNKITIFVFGHSCGFLLCRAQRPMETSVTWVCAGPGSQLLTLSLKQHGS